MPRLVLLLVLTITLICTSYGNADQRNDPREQALSDTLDLWREGRFEQLYDQLSRRTSMSRERFVHAMKDIESKPVCCFNKLSGFRLINEKRTTAKVYARVGMEGGPGSDSSQTREFTLDHEEGRWKVRMADLKALAGAQKKKTAVSRRIKNSHP